VTTIAVELREAFLLAIARELKGREEVIAAARFPVAT
jgi:hypothetical protein